jgi:hypothetical protein
VAFKQHNSLTLACSLEGLPEDWRSRVEAVVRYASPAFDLYVTSVKAGARKRPEGILVSIAREGAEEAWSERVERVLSDRILEEIESSRVAARGKQSAQLRFEMGWDGAGGPSISAEEDLSSLTAAARRELTTARYHLTADLRVAFGEAQITPSSAHFVALAFQQMDHPERWALWARLLLVVAETEAALPVELQRRLMALA